MALPYVHAAESNTIQLALVGCGGRGTGAVENALGIRSGPVKLVAMADVFPQKLSDSHGRLRGKFPSQMDVCRRSGSSSASTPSARRWIA